MTKLCDIVDIKNNDLTSITLEIKDNKELELINLGFDPKLKYIYLSKGENHTLKFIKSDMDSFSIDFGRNGYTLISDDVKDQKNKIIDCISNDFSITYDGERKDFIKTSNIMSLDDKKDLEFKISLYWFNDGDVSMHRDNRFFKFFKNLSQAESYIDKYYNIQNKSEIHKSNQTGCNILDYDVSCKEYSIDNDLEL